MNPVSNYRQSYDRMLKIQIVLSMLGLIQRTFNTDRIKWIVEIDFY